jgi:hypothetical protein
MALFVPTIGQLSGKIGNAVFSHNKGGNYVRSRGLNLKSPSARQSQVRSNLNNASAGWRNLTAAQRTAWKSWAVTHTVINRVGLAIQLSGIAAYNTMAARAIDSAGTIATTPPISAGPSALLTCTGVLTAASDTLALTYTATPLPAGARLAIYASPSLTASQDPGERQSSLVGYTPAAQASPASAVLPYDCVVGTVANIWVSVVDVSGRRSPSLKVRVTGV